jgi:hypothetical protein
LRAKKFYGPVAEKSFGNCLISCGNFEFIQDRKGTFTLEEIMPSVLGIVSRDLMRKKRPADGFIGYRYKISPRYSRIGFIFNNKVVFIFKFLNLYAQPVSL